MLFIFVFSMIFLILRNNLLAVFLGWEGLGITSFLLIIYYQNWSRFQGGLLTLLTNRIGDAILIIRLFYWIRAFFYVRISQAIGIVLTLIFIILTFTKRAQIPFTSWLPAAIAAPTPVRSLVHRSTLVTAGVLLIIKYYNGIIESKSLILIIGFSTLVTARAAALTERDGKKVVALSTLRQLGLMFISLSIRGYYICLFHVVIHAFAKANLFLIVGNYIHSRFSLQDSRFIRVNASSARELFIVIISIISLIGLVFFSGFYSKDIVLIREFRSLSRRITSILLIALISITLLYCVKFLFLMRRGARLVAQATKSKIRILPRVALRVFSVVLGWGFVKNLYIIPISKVRGLYWIFLIIRGIIIGALSWSSWSLLFVTQQIFIKLSSKCFLNSSRVISKAYFNPFLEGFYIRVLFSSKVVFIQRTAFWLTIRVLILLVF